VSDHPSSGTLGRTVWVLVAILAFGCSTQPPAQQDPDVEVAEPASRSLPGAVVGHWVLGVSPEPEEPTARIWLELDIDSVSGGRLFGRLTSYLAGDVGIDPSVFPRFDGTITEGREVTIRIGHVDTAISGFEMRGTLARDTIALDRFAVGPDRVSDGLRRWRLVRVPRVVGG